MPLGQQPVPGLLQGPRPQPVVGIPAGSDPLLEPVGQDVLVQEPQFARPVRREMLPAFEYTPGQLRALAASGRPTASLTFYSPQAGLVQAVGVTEGQ